MSDIGGNFMQQQLNLIFLALFNLETIQSAKFCL